jgi:hypothetical protein
VGEGEGEGEDEDEERKAVSGEAASQCAHSFCCSSRFCCLNELQKKI